MNNTLALNPSLSIIRPMSFSQKAIWILIFASIISLLVVYVFQINSLTRQVYDLRNYEKKLTDLSQENAVLEINFSKANSLENVEDYLKSQSFEKVAQVKYIHIYSPMVSETEIIKNQ